MRKRVKQACMSVGTILEVRENVAMRLVSNMQEVEIESLAGVRSGALTIYGCMTVPEQ